MNDTAEDKTTDATEQAAEKKKPSPALIVLIVAAVAAGAYFFISGQGKIATDDAQVAGHMHKVSPQVTARVIEVLVDDNQEVEEGEVLVRLDDSTFQQKVADAKASLSEAEAARQAAAEQLAILQVTTVEDLNSANAGLATAQASLASAAHAVEIAERGVDAAQANVAAAQATLDLRDFQKTQIANAAAENPGSVSAERKKQSETDYDGAASAKAGADAALAQAQKKLDTANEDLKSAEQAVAVANAMVAKAATGPQQVKAAEAQLAAATAAVDAARAQLQLAEIDLSYCIITAPVAGQIAKKSVEVGNVVMPTTPLLNVIDTANTWVWANYKETQLEDIRPGQKVVMTCDIYPGWTFEGVVDSIDSGTGAAYGLFPPQNATGNYVKITQRVPVKVTIPADQRDPERPLKLGMNINATTMVGE